MRLADKLRPLARYEPWVVLGPLALVQWLALVAFVVTVRHNGWLFYQGGDQTFFYTSSWIVGHGHIPDAAIGWGWSYILVPLTWMFGSSVLNALPAIVLIQVVILLPLALVAVYGIAERIGGRLLGYLSAGLWVAMPYAVIPLFDQRYHAKYVEQFLPQALGLTGLGDFPSMVIVLWSAYFVVRSLDTRALPDAAAAGLLAGFAIGVKPSNALFLGGVAARATRPRCGGARCWRSAPGSRCRCSRSRSGRRAGSGRSRSSARWTCSTWPPARHRESSQPRTPGPRSTSTSTGASCSGTSTASASSSGACACCSGS